MSPLATLLTCTIAAGITMPLGAQLARVERLRPRWLESEFRHGVIAFGGGALLAAVALVLVPEGIRGLPLSGVVLAMLAGALVFMLLDMVLARRKNSAAQLTAMLADFVPEALALGAMLASGSSAVVLLAILIALQNLPEGFNAFRELRDSTQMSANTIVMTFALLALLGPVCGIAGYLLLDDADAIRSAIMLSAAGGILYLMFQDIAPQVRLERRWGPPLGAVAGFLLGVVGHMITST